MSSPTISRARLAPALVLLAALVAWMLVPGGANAAFPGANGKIVYQCSPGNNDVCVMNADGTGQTNLTNNPADDTRPTWSADGTKIAFQSSRDGTSLGVNEIYVMNAEWERPDQAYQQPGERFRPDMVP